jgi:two-component system osmolarity sensor histidine kinase EnvZ
VEAKQSSIHLNGRDWWDLLSFCTLGCGISFALLALLMRTILEPQVVAESSLRISVSVKLMEEVLKTIPPDRIPTGVILKRSILGPEGTSSNQSRFGELLTADLKRTYGLIRPIQPDRPPLEDPWGGYWIQLATKYEPPIWLYRPARLGGSSVWYLPLLRSLTTAGGILIGIILFLKSRVEIPFMDVLNGLPETVIPPLPLIPEKGIAPLHLMSVRINRLMEGINSSADSRRILLRGLIHDISGPQTRMGLQIESLEMQIGGNPRQTIKALSSDLEQLRKITEQLTLLAEKDQTSLKSEQVALDDLCLRVIASYSADSITVNMPRLLVQIDSTGMERSLRNLIDNAFDHGRPPVRIQAWRENNNLSIQVVDHGLGLSSPTIPNMPYQTHAKDRARNLHQGLGLKIVEKFCHDHAGQLKLDKGDFGGLRATMTLKKNVFGLPIFLK